jgi:ABC-type transport system involved in multi-copper enzyme maturation permease subunit
MRWRFANVGLPLLSKELAEMAQRRRTYAVRVAFAVLTYLTSALFLVPIFRTLQRSPKGVLGHGTDVLDVVYAIEWAGLVLFVPAIMSGVLTVEKERNTLQLLFLTKLGPWTIVFEKLLSRLVPVATFLLVSLPLLFVAYLLGGLKQADVQMATAELMLTAFELASIALFCSAFCATSASAFVLSYVLTALVFLFPLLGVLAIFFVNWCSVQMGAGQTALFLFLNAREGQPTLEWLLTSTAGINLDWVFGQRSAPGAGRPFHTTLQPYLVISAVSTLFLILARSALVRRAAPQPKHRVRRMFAWLDARFTRPNDRYGKGILMMSPDSGLPETNPVTWREKRRGDLGRINYLLRVLLVLESPVLAFSVFSAAFGHDNYSTLGTIGLLLWPIAFLLIIVRAAGLIPAEKARQTLDVLLATPLSLSELMGTKMRGLEQMKAVVALPIVFQTLLIAWLRLAAGRTYYGYGPADRQTLATGSEVLFFQFVTGLNIVILFSLAAQLGFGFGLSAKTQGRAATAALAVFVGFCIVPLVVRLTTDEIWARNVMYLSPVADILVNEFPGLGYSGILDVTYRYRSWGPRGTFVPPVHQWQFHPLVHCALFAVIAWTLAVINRRLAARALLRPIGAMSATFHDLQQSNHPLNGTLLDDGSAVRQLFTALRGREPFMFELCGSNGFRLLIGLANEQAAVQFGASDGEPPYFMAIDKHGTLEEGFVEFLVINTPTPIPRRFCLPVETATVIAIEFVSDGTRTSLVNWEEI